MALKRRTHPLRTRQLLFFLKEPDLAKPPHNPQSSPAPADTREVAQQEGFLREVDEALRQDEALALFNRHAKTVATVVIGGLALFAAWLGWDHYRQGQQEARAEQFVAALDQLQAGSLDKASAALAPLAKDGGDGSQVAAKLLSAGIAAEQGHTLEAASQFGQIAADTHAPQPFRDLATIRQIALQFDSMKPEAVVAALKPLAVPGKPWFGSAGELLGIAYMKQGHNDLAGPLFAAISRDKTVPETIRQRSRQMAGLLGVDAIDDVKQASQG
ncbi:MAG: hypothetical protein RLZZ136_641 [Pseudomonadota bacterium]